MSDDEQRIRLEATIRGLVQGVGFRWFVTREASRLGLTGWVANCADGSVAVVAEGPAPAVEVLRRALDRGPSSARVEWVEARTVPARGEFDRFGVRSGAHRGD